MRLSLLALLAAAMLVLPLAQAGSQTDPDAEDDVDDVEVEGGVNCPLPAGTVPVVPVPNGCLWGTGNDFYFNNVDIELVWVNNTADALNLTIQMKAGSAFHAGGEFFGQLPAEMEPFEYTYEFLFTVNGTPYAAGATMDSAGTIELTGVGASFVIWADHILSIMVPWDAIGDPGNGAIVAGLAFTAHGDGDVSLDDRAPNDGAAREYAINRTTGNATLGNTTGNATAGPSGPSAVGATSTSRGPVSGTSTKSTSKSGSAAADGNPTGADEKDTPSLPFIVVSVGLVAFAAFVRRRLA